MRRQLLLLAAPVLLLLSACAAPPDATPAPSGTLGERIQRAQTAPPLTEAEQEAVRRHLVGCMRVGTLRSLWAMEGEPPRFRVLPADSGAVLWVVLRREREGDQPAPAVTAARDALRRDLTAPDCGPVPLAPDRREMLLVTDLRFTGPAHAASQRRG